MWGKPQKSYFFSGPATKRGGGGKGQATKKKIFFWRSTKKILPKMWPLSSRGVGGWVGKALVAG